MGRGVYNKLSIRNNDKEIIPLEHQKDFVKSYYKSIFLENPENKKRGVLAFHKLGSGKTCSALLLADELIRAGKIKRVFILTQGSLRSMWLKEYENTCGRSAETLKDNYIFITTNYDVSHLLPNFNDSLVIIDEFHIMMNSLRNESKTAVAIYKNIIFSNCKTLLLSGTPIFNNLEEFDYILKLLLKDFYKKYGKFENNAAEIGGKFVFTKEEMKKDNPLEGIISYYPGSGTEFYPSVEYMPIIKARMSEYQEYYYSRIFDNENRLVNMEIIKNPQTPAEFERNITVLVAKKRILSRKFSNFVYPAVDIFESRNPDYIKERNKNGWITKENLLSNKLLEKYSPKFVALIKNILNYPNQKHVVFTFYKTRSGVVLLNSIFNHCGIKSAIYSGDLDDRERINLVKKFNSEDNRYGSKIQVLFSTEAGSTGISLFEVRHMHILESATKEILIQQAIGRVIRYKSHINMPKEEQNVKIWRYFSDYNNLRDVKLYYRLKPTRVDDNEPVSKADLKSLEKNLEKFEDKHPLDIEDINFENIERNFDLNYNREFVEFDDIASCNDDNTCRVKTVSKFEKSGEFKPCIDEMLYERGQRTIARLNMFQDFLKQFSITKFTEPVRN